jgi:hypothetical protein
MPASTPFAHPLHKQIGLFLPEQDLRPLYGGVKNTWTEDSWGVHISLCTDANLFFNRIDSENGKVESIPVLVRLTFICSENEIPVHTLRIHPKSHLIDSIIDWTGESLARHEPNTNRVELMWDLPKTTTDIRINRDGKKGSVAIGPDFGAWGLEWGMGKLTMPFGEVRLFWKSSDLSKSPAPENRILLLQAKEKNTILEFVECCYCSCRSDQTPVFNNKVAEWLPFRAVRRLLGDDLYIDDVVVNDIVSDAKNFVKISTLHLYAETFRPYRRSYLLTGPAGCGKTSMAMAVAGEVDCRLYSVQANNTEHLCNILQDLIDAIPARNVLLIENIESLCGRRSPYNGKCTWLSRVANILDGVASGDHGIITIMTARNEEDIDPMLMRPGLIDRHFKVGYMGTQQVLKMWHRYFGRDVSGESEFAKQCRGLDLTPGILHEYFGRCMTGTLAIAARNANTRFPLLRDLVGFTKARTAGELAADVMRA